MLSPGRLYGLQQISNEAGVFSILALDHGRSFQSAVNPSAPEAVSQDEVRRLKSQLLRRLAPHAGGVLLDPVTGLAAALQNGRLPDKTGIVLSIEDGDYEAPDQSRRCRLLENWDVAGIKAAGAAAVKLFFYYHPDHPETVAYQESILVAVSSECRAYDLPLMVEPLSYDTPPEDRPRVVIESARRLGRFDIDILKLEFPVDTYFCPDEAVWQARCEALNDVCRVPWVLLSAGTNFETFARQVEIACSAGASGFVAGRAIWADAAARPDDEFEAFAETVTIPRLKRLTETAIRKGRSWQTYPGF
ncbi:MAG: tagatose 1,6-diphosphate aldolase [Candidatus Promineifilaceae bacterium]